MGTQRSKALAVNTIVVLIVGVAIMATIAVFVFYGGKKTVSTIDSYELPDLNTCYYHDFSRDYSKDEVLGMVKTASRRVWYFGGACLINVSITRPILLRDIWDKAKEGQDTLITLSYNDCTWMDIGKLADPTSSPLDPEYDNPDGNNPIVIWKSRAVDQCTWNLFNPGEIIAGFTNIISVAWQGQAKDTLMITTPELYCGKDETALGGIKYAKRIPGNNVAAYGLSQGRYNNDKICTGSLALPRDGGEKTKGQLDPIVGYCHGYLSNWWTNFWSLFSTLVSSGAAGPGASIAMAWHDKLLQGSDPLDNIIACTGYYYNTSMSPGEVFNLAGTYYNTDPTACRYDSFDPSNWLSSESPGERCAYVVVEDGRKMKLVKTTGELGSELNRIKNDEGEYRIEFFILTDPSKEGADSSDLVVLIRKLESD